MKAHEWMVTYTPQTDWIKGSGAIVWLSFFTGIFGSGAYLASLYFNNLTGIIISWIIIAILKGGLHVGHARRPLRLWRMVIKFRTSWIARGTVFTACTVLFGALQIFLSYTNAGTPVEITFRVLTGIAALAVMIYEAFTINYISGIPFWKLIATAGYVNILGCSRGLALMTVVTPITSMDDVSALSRIILIITLVLTTLYLWNALYAGATSKESMKEMVKGVLFWIGVVFIGFVVPLIILFATGAPGLPSAIAFLVCEVIGSLTFTYCVFKVGVYRPLIQFPMNEYRRL